jgi:predicted lipoprotein with Yx(FWY)xxD motif
MFPEGTGDRRASGHSYVVLTVISLVSITVRRRFAPLIVLLGLVAAACGGSSSPANNAGGSTSPSGGSTSSSGGSTSSSVKLTTKNVSGLGSVLVDGSGRTLYVFAPDKAAKVTCTGQCAAVWPPEKIASGQKPAVSGGVQASLVSTDPNPGGGSVVTYHGWPLYLYVADPTAGTAHGQALNSSGGLWYVISPSGQVIKKHAGAGSSSNGNGY